MTQAQLAEAAGITRTHLVRIEAERKWPQHHQRLTGALGFVLGDELMKAAITAREKLARAPKTVVARCASCGTRIDPPAARRGRPRKRCASCAADRSALGRAWRAAHGAEVAAYNASRR